MNLEHYRMSALEQKRTASLLNLSPRSGETALDIGARDGHFSKLLADRFEGVIALDLEKPLVHHAKVRCVKGNAARLDFADNSIDFVFCAEVLEHVPPSILGDVCGEIARVCRGQMLIGVPYRQDIRIGRTTCYSCMGVNPPWGHVNAFDERRLSELFPNCGVDAIDFVGTNSEHTNSLSTWLMDKSGNPYGTYEQDEPCIHCGKSLSAPKPRSLGQKVLTKLAFWSRLPSTAFGRPRANWIHMLMTKRAAH